ncbi:hypothetical protein C4577_03575 [Candidatus Parcubacteria bacterium]|nr:MAG: hypothetical protein C4577_03575 [Candidatus Parcubacteria bacterium]
MNKHSEERRIASKIVEAAMKSLQSMESFNKLFEKSDSKLYYHYIDVLTDVVEKIIILEWPYFEDDDLFYSGG